MLGVKFPYKALKLDNVDHCSAIQNILLIMLLWQLGEDAGIPSFTNGHHFHLPGLFSGLWNIKCVFHHLLSIHSQNTSVARLGPAQRDASQSATTNAGGMVITGTRTSRMGTPDKTEVYCFQSGVGGDDGLAFSLLSNPSSSQQNYTHFSLTQSPRFLP